MIYAYISLLKITIGIALRTYFFSFLNNTVNTFLLIIEFKEIQMQLHDIN